jgi:hypothetical protein
MEKKWTIAFWLRRQYIRCEKYKRGRFAQLIEKGLNEGKTRVLYYTLVCTLFFEKTRVSFGGKVGRRYRQAAAISLQRRTQTEMCHHPQARRIEKKSNKKRKGVFELKSLLATSDNTVFPF